MPHCWVRSDVVIRRHVRDKRGRLLTETIQEIEDLQSKIEDFNKDLESLRAVMNAIDKEINQSGASVANLRENIRVRRLIKDIAATQAKIDTFDMEEAAKAKRNFQEKYPIEKQRETDMQSKVYFQFRYENYLLNILAVRAHWWRIEHVRAAA